ncbi:hypothetical protein C8N47_11429 [Mangrovibacterium marinum]|uniref:Uncharacterized protein n=1 Tax=Mangrovibacterium marinum TaxID=1639118 RepID=A0A2T5BZH2_9BACT|nr:hypothetical protein C8N47_11429 [Mangrovibacterium marinum]
MPGGTQTKKGNLPIAFPFRFPETNLNQLNLLNHEFLRPKPDHYLIYVPVYQIGFDTQNTSIDRKYMILLITKTNFQELLNVFFTFMQQLYIQTAFSQCNRLRIF